MTHPYQIPKMTISPSNFFHEPNCPARYHKWIVTEWETIGKIKKALTLTCQYCCESKNITFS